VGTTGWYNRLPEIRELASSGNQALLHSTNFSIGVNVVFHLNRELARIMNGLPEYEPSITEIHHTAKLDKPSGTAITMGEDILAGIYGKTSWVNHPAESSDQLGIISIREGDVPGTHTIHYESEADSIFLTHEAKNRTGFALGAVKAAEWIHGKKGYFTMRDFLQF
jgi:4-hydroxy-tetrahydrodipicolinate reductase